MKLNKFLMKLFTLFLSVKSSCCSETEGEGKFLDQLLTGISDITKTTFDGLVGDKLKRSMGFFSDSDSDDCVKFTLFTNQSCEDGEPLVDWNLNGTKWDKEKPVKIIIHGFTPLETLHLPAIGMARMKIIKDKYFEYDYDANIIMVDWRNLTKTFFYFNAARDTKRAGEILAKAVYKWVKEGFIEDPSCIHMIGFSLGAHVAGVAGHKLYHKLQKRVGRITGLDPARPGFYKKRQKTSAYLDPSDAEFVDALHCNGGQLGTNLGVAHADFFPNGGSSQRECEFMPVFAQICNHLQCVQYFSNSIENTSLYKGCKCSDWETYSAGKCDCDDSKNIALMGEGCSDSTLGKFYLTA